MSIWTKIYKPLLNARSEAIKSLLIPNSLLAYERIEGGLWSGLVLGSLMQSNLV